MRRFAQYLIAEGRMKDETSLEVSKQLDKKLKGENFFDDSLYAHTVDKKNTMTLNTSNGKVVVWYEEGTPANGKKVYKYNFRFK